MPPSQRTPPQPQNTSISPRSSAAPLLPAEQPGSQQYTDDGATEGEAKVIDPKTGKRRLFGLVRSKEPQKMEAPAVGGLLPSTQAAVNAMKPPQKAHPQPIPLSPSRLPNPAAAAASPSWLRSSSPRLHSPASSEIFERNVQEPVALSTLQGELDPAHIPAHVITEDHIPAALEASAQAITSEELNPDEVEIVTSSSHQPAAEKVLEASASHADLTSPQSPTLRHHASEGSEIAASIQQLQAVVAAENDGATNYGHLDPNDVRRLSFISFADVVHSEHEQQAASSALGDPGSRDSLHLASLPSSLPERAASPLRSPRSPGGVTTPPPPGVSIDSAGEQSPSRSQTGLASPMTGGGQHGELTIETMRQAVRKTASGDLSGVRSAGMSPISDENSGRETRSRTNS